jgi:hypothetical protein
VEKHQGLGLKRAQFLSTVSPGAMQAQFGPGVTLMKERKAAKRDKKKSGGHAAFIVKDA